MRSLNTVATPRLNFPVAEGVGIFIGIAAYDLLTDGRMDLLKSLSIAVPAAIVWYAFRLLKDRLRDKQPPRQPKIN